MRFWNSLAVATPALVALVVAVVGVPATASAQSTAPPKEDHSIVYEIGWAGSWSHDEGWQTKGATFAFEVTPIEDRLELEVGVTAIRSHGITETSADLLFKKPWTLSKHVEFMAGVGPEIVHAAGAGTFAGFSAVGDLMVWPRKNVGWYLEPGWEVDFPSTGRLQGFAIAGGLIIGR